MNTTLLLKQDHDAEVKTSKKDIRNTVKRFKTLYKNHYINETDFFTLVKLAMALEITEGLEAKLDKKDLSFFKR